MQKKYDFEFVDGCWEWRGMCTTHGYGTIKIKPRKYRAAHRVFYEAFRGEILDGLVVHHHCNNKGCVNPLHLDAVTHHQNILYAAEDGLIGDRLDDRGEALEIRSAFKQGVDVRELTDEFGWGVNVIYRVIRGEHPTVDDLDRVEYIKKPVDLPGTGRFE